MLILENKIRDIASLQRITFRHCSMLQSLVHILVIKVLID